MMKGRGQALDCAVPYHVLPMHGARPTNKRSVPPLRGVQPTHLEDLGAICPVAGALAHNLCWVDQVVQHGLVHLGRGARQDRASGRERAPRSRCRANGTHLACRSDWCKQRLAHAALAAMHSVARRPRCTMPAGLAAATAAAAAAGGAVPPGFAAALLLLLRCQPRQHARACVRACEQTHACMRACMRACGRAWASQHPTPPPTAVSVRDRGLAMDLPPLAGGMMRRVPMNTTSLPLNFFSSSRTSRGWILRKAFSRRKGTWGAAGPGSQGGWARLRGRAGW